MLFNDIRTLTGAKIDMTKNLPKKEGNKIWTSYQEHVCVCDCFKTQPRPDTRITRIMIRSVYLITNSLTFFLNSSYELIKITQFLLISCFFQ